jgi:alcohol dehydrogenase class IV
VLLAKETVNLVAKYLPIATKDPGNLEARYYLLYASMIAGICFDNGLLHYTHALEHPLSGIKPDLAHGLGLGMILPAVIKTIYPACPEILAAIYEPYVPGLKGVAGEAQQCAVGVEKWLCDVGVKEKLSDMGYTEQDVDKLTKLAFETPSLDFLLSMAPVKATKEIVSGIYRDSMKPMH